MDAEDEKYFSTITNMNTMAYEDAFSVYIGENYYMYAPYTNTDF